MPHLKPIFLIASLFALVMFWMQTDTVAASRALAPSATYTVNSTADTDDGTCDATNCTLREAINAANANSNADTIEFNIGSGTPTIAVGATGLPTITQPVTINGNTGGATRVELNGTGTGASVNGLKITGGSSTIRNLVINRFGDDGIEINTGGSNVVEGCYIGFASDGATKQTNLDGIYIFNSSNNTIGGTTSATRNLITGSRDGIFLDATTTTTGNVIQGNYIGTDVSGTLARGGSGAGIGIYYSDGNTIGGTASGAGNVIVDFSGYGIDTSYADSNFIQGNIIGLAANGSTALQNYSGGIELLDSMFNTIGGTTHTANTCDGACNLIAGNGGEGIFISGSVSSDNNVVQGNFIGTDKTGTLDRGNTDDGIWISGGTGNTIGGAASGAGNVISGNNSDGIRLSGTSTTSNQIQGNYIGTSANGAADLGNMFSGVYIYQGTNNTIGGTASGARNVISGNRNGVYMDGGATGNLVQGNYIGTNAAGTGALGNDIDGVYLEAPSNTIGGTASGARNVISGNNVFGIEIYGSTASGNTVQGNYIGTNASGTGDLGNTFEGVIIGDAANNTIGGTTSAHRNVISGNGGAGVDIYGSTLTGNVVQGNYIGTQSNGTSALGNDSHGVWIETSASNNTVGGAASGAGNVIAFNAADGVYVQTGTGNQIRRNSIFSNGGLGIDADVNGVTANDTGDGDTGANNKQNFPILATAQQGSTVITGSFNSTANTSFTLEFFSSPGADASSNGEGKTFLCDTTVTTDGSGNAAINVSCATTTMAGNVVTATATRNSSPFDTSEFSNAVTVSAPTAFTISEFTAQVQDARVQLNWTTANELNVLGFQVYRREGKRDETKLNAELIPAQNPGELISNTYAFEDANVRAGKKYVYRLQVVFANGESESVEPIEVKIPKDASACAAKPKAAKLFSPQNGETVNARRVMLDWNDVKCAAMYSLVIRQGDAKGKMVERANDLTTSEFTTKQLKRGETYFWSVRACSAVGCGKARGGTFMIRP